MAKTRRTFLKLFAAAAASMPFLGRIMPQTGMAPGFQMVNGWILTDADVEKLRDFGL